LLNRFDNRLYRVNGALVIKTLRSRSHQTFLTTTITTTRAPPVISMVDAVRVQHRNNLEDDVFSEDFCRRVVTNEKIYNA